MSNDQKDDLKKTSLEYHAKSPAGKIATKLTKPINYQNELAMAYSPGVAFPCLEIEKNPDDAFKYTGKGNLVGVITDGSAVLGLGNIGAQASKPVMEGKGMLFKKYANIDVFDIELDASDQDKFIECVKALEPTFGGINLEDIKAPNCFYIEEELKKVMNIPVFHDDQHGTAIIAAAAFINAIEITKKELSKIKLAVLGAGAAAIACANLLVDLGMKKENILMCDSKGVIYEGRTERMNPYKQRYANKTKKRTLEEAMDGADAFLGVSFKDLVTEKMVLSMAEQPIIFALANPDPEISPELIHKVRKDAIVATGRSDFPNQVNNVLGFPYIFRGALDVRATCINEAMKKAAVMAIANLAKSDVPDSVRDAYDDDEDYKFGKGYLIPKPVDTRVLMHVAPAVAQAAMDSGVARKKIDIKQYKEEIEQILGPEKKLMRQIRNKIKSKTSKKRKKIFFPRYDDKRILRSANQIAEEGIIDVGIIGTRSKIIKHIESFGLSGLENKIHIFDPIEQTNKLTELSQKLFELRSRKGVSKPGASQLIRNPHYLAAMLLETGEIDGIISGITQRYPYCVRPILETIHNESNEVLAGIYMMAIESKLYFFADCTIHEDPSPEVLAQIAISTADLSEKYLSEKPRVAMLSYSSYGSAKQDSPLKVKEATSIAKELRPDLAIDGEIQADFAIQTDLRSQEFPFNTIGGDANVLIFPTLNAGNIAAKMLNSLTDTVGIGPILIGLKKPAYVLQTTSTTEEIINMAYIAAYESLAI